MLLIPQPVSTWESEGSLCCFNPMMGCGCCRFSSRALIQMCPEAPSALHHHSSASGSQRAA